MLIGLLSNSDLSTVASEMATRFQQGIGGTYSNSILTQYVQAHATTQKYVDTMKKLTIDELILNGGNIERLLNDYDFQKQIQDNVRLPVFNNIGNLFNGLQILINDVWGSTVSIKNYYSDGKTFNGTLCFTLFDHFGLDLEDIEKAAGSDPGFRAWYVLQHYDKLKGQFRPFITEMYFEVPFGGIIL